MEDLCPTSHSMAIPFVKREEYTVMDISEDGQASLLTEGGDTKEDLNMPTQTDEDKKMSEDMKKDLEAGKNCVVIVQSACGMEKIISYKTTD